MPVKLEILITVPILLFTRRVRAYVHEKKIIYATGEYPTGKYAENIVKCFVKSNLRVTRSLIDDIFFHFNSL